MPKTSFFEIFYTANSRKIRSLFSPNYKVFFHIYNNTHAKKGSLGGGRTVKDARCKTRACCISGAKPCFACGRSERKLSFVGTSKLCYRCTPSVLLRKPPPSRREALRTLAFVSLSEGGLGRAIHVPRRGGAKCPVSSFAADFLLCSYFEKFCAGLKFVLQTNS